jgi:hypothetical protein
MRYLPTTTVRALDIQGIGPLSRFIEKVPQEVLLPWEQEAQYIMC